MRLLIVTQKVDEEDQLLGFFIDWLKRFSNKFEEVFVICLKKGNFDLPGNVKVISLGKERGVSKIGQLFNFYKTILKLRGRYNSVFVHMNPIWVVLGGIIWRLSSKKIFFWYTSGGVTLKLRIAEKLANSIFTASKESFRLPSRKVIITGHGINTDLFKPNPSERSDQLNILSIGRIAPVKNYEILINTAKYLKDEGFKFSVTMIGGPALKKDKDYEKKIKDMVKNFNLDNYFNFVGKVNHKDLPRFYQSHHLFIHLSKTGSLDKVSLEAMASGMVILSSNDAAKLFLPKELIFKENDSVGLAKKIKEVAKNKQGYNLRDYVVKNHNLGNLIENISSIIND